MNRLLVVLAVTAVLLLLGAAGPASQPSTTGGAAAADCNWQRHTKRVVKRVHRHGKVRRVVRRKHWWTCVPQAAAPTAVPPAPTPPAPTTEPEPEANRLSVKGAEFYFVLSRPTVKAGEVTIELNNRGEDPHNLNLRLEGAEGEPLQLPETASQQRSVDNFDLAAGKYRLWCSLPEHEALGMATTLVVE